MKSLNGWRTARVLLAHAILWMILVEGDWGSWPLGAPVVGITTLIQLRLLRGTGGQWRLPAMARLLGLFLVWSFLGGLDVARRALSWHPALAPEFVWCRFRLPPGEARVAFTNATSLMPGTFVADQDADRYLLHVLDRTRDWERVQVRLESAVADAFGVALDRAPGGPS